MEISTKQIHDIRVTIGKNAYAFSIEAKDVSEAKIILANDLEKVIEKLK